MHSDHGTENVGVWLYMEELRGRDCHSYIAGRSVHNCRIEQLWKDVYNAVTTNYVAVFTKLEQEGILDPEKETDLFCLHYKASKFLISNGFKLSVLGLLWS